MSFAVSRYDECLVCMPGETCETCTDVRRCRDARGLDYGKVKRLLAALTAQAEIAACLESDGDADQDELVMRLGDALAVCQARAERSGR